MQIELQSLCPCGVGRRDYFIFYIVSLVSEIIIIYNRLSLEIDILVSTTTTITTRSATGSCSLYYITRAYSSVTEGNFFQCFCNVFFQRIMGCRFLAPVYCIPLVEISKSRFTAQETVKRCKCSLGCCQLKARLLFVFTDFQMRGSFINYQLFLY